MTVILARARGDGRLMTKSQMMLGSDTAPVGRLNTEWIHGSPSPWCRTDPAIQVYHYDAETVILRQSKDVSFEAPFMYLLFGKQRVLLLDTGATGNSRRFPLRGTVDRLITEYLGTHPRDDYELIVGHTHGHRDHTSGDKQFAGRPNTRLITTDLNSVRSFFGIADWPNGSGQLELGGRTLEVLPTPGHDPRSISVYDPSTQFLITGDIVYPGRLYVFDSNAFVQSLNRLVHFTEYKPVSFVMGCHIEMTQTLGKDYPATVRYQPNEPPLQMTVAQLIAVRDAAEAVGNRPGVYNFGTFIIFNGPCYGAVLRQLLRASWMNLEHLFGVSPK